MVSICFTINPVGIPKTNGRRRRRKGGSYHYSWFQRPTNNYCCYYFYCKNHVDGHSYQSLAAPAIKLEKANNFKWVEIRSDKMTEEQKLVISKLPPDMSNRCKAVMRQIICSNFVEKPAYDFQATTTTITTSTSGLSDLLKCWVRIMKPRRTDWLSLLKQLQKMDHPLFISVAEFALCEESFEANVRDYTKLIHYFGKQNRLEDAENTLFAMKRRGFVCDQVMLTTVIQIYSKANNLKLAKETFEELKLLGQPLDNRSYGAMIMAYIRAGMPEEGEVILREMDKQEICAGTEVYKALLRSYSMAGNAEGAQRVFDAIQFAGIPPDARVCALLINAYRMTGQSQKARIAFENMRSAGFEPNDRCVALVLASYDWENELDKALNFLIDLEREGIVVGKEASELLAAWFKRLGVVKEVETILREFTASEATSVVHTT